MGIKEYARADKTHAIHIIPFKVVVIYDVINYIKMTDPIIKVCS